LWFFFGRIRDDDATLDFFALLDALNENAISEGLYFEFGVFGHSGVGKVGLPGLGGLHNAEGMPKRFLAGLAIVYVVFLGLSGISSVN
jgi:hypothetical protein